MKRTLVTVGVTALITGSIVLAPPLGIGDAPQPLVPPSYNPMESFAPLVQAVNPAVVSIETAREVDIQIPPEFRHFFGGPEGFGPDRREGVGSGFIVSAEGLVLTNQHVIRGSDSLKVTLADGDEVSAEVVGSDPSIDVALLQLPTDREWPFVELGSSATVEVGDWVVAVGNPLGLGHTVTAGIISGVGRDSVFSPWQRFLQTDAAINPGNSGGPLFDLQGRVIGMNTAIISGANTVGFAIPIDMIQEILEELRTEGRISRGFIGVSTGEITPEMAYQLNLEPGSGALVNEVHPATPAAEAGLRRGDIILTVNGQPVTDATSLTLAISANRPGDLVEMRVLRGGQERTLRATLVDRDEWMRQLEGERRRR